MASTVGATECRRPRADSGPANGRILGWCVSGSTCIQVLLGDLVKTTDFSSVVLRLGLGFCSLTSPQVEPILQIHRLHLGRGCLGHYPGPHLHPLLFISPTYKSQCQYIPAYTIGML